MLCLGWHGSILQIINQKEGDILIHTLTFCISGAFCCKKALCGWTSWKIQLSKPPYDRCWSGEVSYYMITSSLLSHFIFLICPVAFFWTSMIRSLDKVIYFFLLLLSCCCCFFILSLVFLLFPHFLWNFLKKQLTLSVDKTIKEDVNLPKRQNQKKQNPQMII